MPTKRIAGDIGVYVMWGFLTNALSVLADLIKPEPERPRAAPMIDLSHSARQRQGVAEGESARRASRNVNK